ncbi:hypothetical protein [Mammaliicoccus sp. I-M36]|uniref:hypothetical protein n=1 Tax=Mammaliicoccus sp. I-M36 TaxID=2898695 RepID=UPI001EFB8370|nr:hypothetical protein [Mammaliicoccus sp. I-M36]
MIDKFIKDLITETLATIASQERNESKLLQTQYVQAKKDTQKYVIYHQIIKILEKDKNISNIVKEVNIKGKNL